MLMKVVLVLFFFLFHLSQQEVPVACFLWKNSFVKITANSPEKQILTFSVKSLQRDGWMGVQILSNPLSFNKGFGVLGGYPNQIYQLQNHSNLTPKNEKIIFNEKIENKWQLVVDGVLSYSFQINSTDLPNINYIYLANNPKQKPIGNDSHITVLKHEGISNQKILILNGTNPLPECNNELNLPGRSLALHWSIYLITSTFYILIGYAFLQFSNDQPFKSRFISPFIAIICLYFNLFGEYLTYSVYYEHVTHYLCIINGYLIYSMLQVV